MTPTGPIWQRHGDPRVTQTIYECGFLLDVFPESMLGMRRGLLDYVYYSL